jgi:hypothetical protein
VAVGTSEGTAVGIAVGVAVGAVVVRHPSAVLQVSDIPSQRCADVGHSQRAGVGLLGSAMQEGRGTMQVATHPDSG